MKPRPSLGLVVGSLLLVVVASGACAKRPALTVASAPPPTAQPVAPAPPPVVAPLPAAPAPAAAPAAVAPAAPKEFAPNTALAPIHFDFDKSDIRLGDTRILNRNAEWLKAHPDNLVLVEGHCDERGTNQYNLALGDRRARAAMQYLVSIGVDATRITTISYGEDRPLCAAHTEACWAQNRRAMFLTKGR